MQVAVSKKMTGAFGVVASIIGLISADKIDDVKFALFCIVIIVAAYLITQGIVDAVKAWHSKD